jgi:ribosomal protein S18 acetylase RimI-like enzyme
MVGFVLGGPSGQLAAAQRRFLTSHLVVYALETLRRPALYAPALRRLVALLGSHVHSPKPTSDADVNLLSIAVTSDAKGTGAAEMLLHSFEQAIYPAPGYSLSVLKTNPRAIRFYEKHGFLLDHGDEGTLHFVKSLLKK